MIIPRNQPTSRAYNVTPPHAFSDPHRRNKIDLYKCMDTDFTRGRGYGHTFILGGEDTERFRLGGEDT